MGFVPGEEMIDDADVDELEVDDAAVAEAEAEGAGDEPIGVEAHPPSPEVALAAAATTDDDGMVFLDDCDPSLVLEHRRLFRQVLSWSVSRRQKLTCIPIPSISTGASSLLPAIGGQPLPHTC